MKSIIITFAILICNYANGQDRGIRFEHNTTWENILAKAKLENKFIFIDCYTTWCGPCRGMAAQIFPLAVVGDFYNKNFVNLKLQFDSTQNDDEDVKSHYALAGKISQEYNIVEYPTFLFFDAAGNIVHKVVGSSPAEAFIARGADAINPEKQYYKLKQQYEDGRKDSAFLYDLVKISKAAGEPEFSKKVCYEYLAAQPNLYTLQNIELLQGAINSSRDPGFEVMLRYPKRVDSILGKGMAAGIVNSVIVHEEVNPRINTKEIPDWALLKANLEAKYPKQSDEVFFIAKMNYARKKEDWMAFGNAVINYMRHYEEKLPADQLDEYAFIVFLNCDDKNLLKNALAWSKKSLTYCAKIDADHMETYANLLYKLGIKNAALSYEQKAQKIAIEQGAEKSWGEDVITKMEKGEKTW